NLSEITRSTEKERPAKAFRLASDPNYANSFALAAIEIGRTSDPTLLPALFNDRDVDKDEYSLLVGQLGKIEGVDIDRLPDALRNAHEHLKANNVPLAGPFVWMVEALVSYASEIEVGLNRCIQDSCTDEQGGLIKKTDAEAALKKVQDAHNSALRDIAAL